MAQKDSLLAHCLARAIIAEQGGLEAAAEKYGPNAERLSKWRATALAVKVTPKASRVASPTPRTSLATRSFRELLRKLRIRGAA